MCAIHTQKSQPFTNKTKFYICFFAFAAGLYVWAMFFLHVDSSTAPYLPPQQTEYGYHVRGFDCVKQEVMGMLKAPSTAKFTDWTESLMNKTGDNQYRFVSYVDSQNGFGAMLRTRFACDVQFESDGKTCTASCVLQ